MWTLHLKGQCHENFDLWFFSWLSFPQALEYTIKAVSNFFENSRRYSQLKVHHRCHCQICRWCHWYRRQFCRWCRWYWCCTWLAEYLHEFSKKFEMVLMGYSGAGGKLIHEKNQKQKISWHCPFNSNSQYPSVYLTLTLTWIVHNLITCAISIDCPSLKRLDMCIPVLKMSAEAGAALTRRLCTPAILFSLSSIPEQGNLWRTKVIGTVLHCIQGFFSSWLVPWSR